MLAFLGPALMLQLMSAEDMERVENQINPLLRDPDLVVAVTSPDTLKPAAAILEKNIRIPADHLDRELVANIEALTKASFFDMLAPPKTIPADGRRSYLGMV
jgi:hypothetical protein